MQKIQDGRHLVQSKVSFAGYVKKGICCFISRPTESQISLKRSKYTIFYIFFFNMYSYWKKNEKKFFFKKKLGGGRVGGVGVTWKWC